MTIELTATEAEQVGRKVVGMVDRLVAAERFVPPETGRAAVRWHFWLEGQRYVVALTRAPCGSGA